MKPKSNERIVRLVLLLLSRPYGYTKKALATHFEISLDRIDEDFIVLKNIGIRLDKDEEHQYAILIQKDFKELSYLQPLSEADRGKIKTALYEKYGTKDAMYIEGKLASLYDFQELGLRALRQNSLDKIDQLKAAQKNKKRVVLEQYQSNSGTIKDRLVEPFYLDVEMDTLQAFDVEAQETRHYKLARMERVKMTEEKWQNKSYTPEQTDVFRIVNDQQIRVHLKLKAQAYNYLVEQYPKSRSEIRPSAEPQTWDFEAKVNRNFFGLSNFILANTEHVEVLSPLVLKEHIKEKIKAFLDKLE